MINTVFFGTPDFVLPICEALRDLKEFHLAAVITSPDKPVGRKQILTPSPVKQWALSHKIPVFTPEKLSTTNSQFPLSNIQGDLGVLAAYGKIIPQEIIDFFPKGILVIHPSLLPKYRGASPVPAAILAGDKETGVTIFKMDNLMDHGPIVTQFREKIKADDTTESLLTRLFSKTTDILLTILKPYIEDKIIPTIQDHKKATFCPLLKKEDGKINWHWPTPKIDRLVRAMIPWPGAFTYITLNTKRQIPIVKRLKILETHLSLNTKYLILDTVQLEGKNPVSWRQFKQAYPEFEVTF
ncbi:MAG: methionyl-tRNA formyltransferase [Patescibacteria group bacterium]|nr:methionyl-tRNA formyltransferase [Patescibacteria group bacterium]MCL5095672.1 methionyl-tRNA formyltransferase [Patescibacteria group bacterium]